MLRGYDDSSRRADPVESERRLGATVERCRVRAQRSRQPVLLRLHLDLPVADPWTFLDANGVHREPFVAWNDGRTGLCVAAFGEGEKLEGEKRDRFSHARRFAAQLRDRVVEVPWQQHGLADPHLPAAFAGFAFDPERSSDSGPWARWPAGLVYVPAVMVYRRGGGASSGVVLHTRVAADAAIESVVGHLGRIVQDLRRRAAVSAPAVPLEAPTGVELSCRLLEDRATWCGRVAAARAAADAGLLEKVVLARAADYLAPAGSHFAVLPTIRMLRSQHRSAVCFAIGRPGAGCFLGATPEILAQVSGVRLTTQALAGTAPRLRDPSADARVGRALVRSAKDRREHAVVAQVLKNALAEFCQDLHCPAEPRLVRLPQVQHLETPFVGTLRKPGGILDLVERLHPTPSVGGWPAPSASAWLAEHEPLRRGWYAGPVGWLTAAGDGVFAVAIRSLLSQHSTARAYAGAGIVAASDPDAEWQETELKLRTVRAAMRLAT